MKGLVFIFLFTCTINFVSAQSEKELIQLTDMRKIKTAGNVAVSNNECKAAFTLTSIEPDDKSKLDYRYVTRIYTVDMKPSAAPRQLTFANESSSSPAWSPDGKKLAFVRSVEGKSQIFILSTSGGEAWQLTRSNYGAFNPRWSPDGNKILFSSSVTMKDLLNDSILNPSHDYPLWPSEKPGISNADMQRAAKVKANPNGNIDEIRAYLLQDEADGKATVLNKLNFQDETNVTNAMRFTQFFMIDVNPSAKAKPIVTGFFPFNEAAFTPDGKKLIITANIDSLRHPDRTLESEIYVADADGRNLKLLLGKKGMSYNNARLSPSGKWLAFLYAPINAYIPALAIMPLNGSIADAVTFPFDRNKSNFVWSSDEKFIYFTAQSNGGVLLYRLNISTKKIDQLSDFNSGINAFDIGKDKIIFTKNEVSDPSEIYMADAAMNHPTKLSAFNDWVKEKKLSLPEKKTFTNSKGLQIEYWVMKPINFQTNKKYPLLLEIHGGPMTMWGPGEASMWHEFQYFTAKGYGVVYCNPRGSGGYGYDFLRANMNDWAAGPSSDVLTALDKTVAEGWADTTKLLITGGSYAGYLTAWIIAHDKRFKAACSQRGVYDLATFFGEGNAWQLIPEYFGGYPWEPRVKEILQRESPITYVQNISTPYIIFHGDNDRRTGFVQGEMMYRSLKILGRPVEYVRQPGATHEITRSGDIRQRMDQMLRTYEFFERWLK